MTDAEVLRDPHWLPMGLGADGSEVRFARADEAAVRDATFLTAAFAERLPSATLPADALLTAAPRGAPASWIWHTAFCRSTLLARALDAPGLCRALREPTLLMELANLTRVPPRRGPLAPPLREACIALLTRRVHADERVLIKPTNAANNLLAPVLAARGEDRVLLLHSPLEDFLLSLHRKGQAGASFVRRLLKVILMDAGGAMEPAQLAELTDLQVAALAWHIQLEGLARAVTSAPQRVRVLDSTRLGAAPHATLVAVAAWLGLAHDAARIEAVVAGPVFARDAKGARDAYDPQAIERDREAARAALGPDLDAVTSWARTISRGAFPLAALPPLG
jgi:hypothetical protein